MSSENDKYSFDKHYVKPFEGSADDTHWAKNSQAYLHHYDSLLLGLKTQALGSSNANFTKWRVASAHAKGAITCCSPIKFQFEPFNCSMTTTRLPMSSGSFKVDAHG